jgi:single-stranded DNA-binding protein
MIDILASGKLFGVPTKRTSKGGSVYVTGKLRVATGDAPTYINFICFRETVGAALLALGDGTPCAIAGDMKITSYTARDGTTKPSIDLTVSEILTPYHADRRRKAMTKEHATTSEPTRSQQLPLKSAAVAAGEEDFNDEIPF